MKTNKRKARRAKDRRRNPNLSLFQRLSPAESRQARAIAFEAALAVIG
ncbi:MAG: hypothetical protein ACTHN4_01685 [Sphingomicrobium sp.]